jgi:type II secretory ATPase GspE/PulE/Tfp pilus assembly ATPase PilB-like protein
MSSGVQYASEFIRANRAVRLPDEAGVPVVGMVDPEDVVLRSRIEHYHGCPVSVRRISEGELLSRLSRLVGERFDESAEGAHEPGGHGPGDVGASGAGAPAGAAVDGLSPAMPAVGFVDALLHDAVVAGATDVHLETAEVGARLRYRVDGVLHTVREYDTADFATVVSRLKVLSRVTATERRLPQDGRFSFEALARHYDVRTSFLPCDRGESVAIRLLEAAADERGLEELGVRGGEARALGVLDLSAGGLVVVAGPTGSGKTTTVHALLRRWADGTRKVVTAEDPVEYRLAGVTQVPVRRAIGLDFDAILRRALRHDPDVLMVGEVRDPETAALAVRGALSGHPVFATVHAADTPTIATRFENLGVTPHLLADVVAARVSQRLVRRVCPRCAELREPGGAERELARAAGVTLESVRVGRGCPACRDTGFRGRIGLFRVESAGYRSPSLEAAGWLAVARGETAATEVAGLGGHIGEGVAV